MSLSRILHVLQDTCKFLHSLARRFYMGPLSDVPKHINQFCSQLNGSNSLSISASSWHAATWLEIILGGISFLPQTWQSFARQHTETYYMKHRQASCQDHLMILSILVVSVYLWALWRATPLPRLLLGYDVRMNQVFNSMGIINTLVPGRWLNINPQFGYINFTITADAVLSSISM